MNKLTDDIDTNYDSDKDKLLVLVRYVINHLSRGKDDRNNDLSAIKNMFLPEEFITNIILEDKDIDETQIEGIINRLLDLYNETVNYVHDIWLSNSKNYMKTSNELKRVSEKTSDWHKGLLLSIFSTLFLYFDKKKYISKENVLREDEEHFL